MESRIILSICIPTFNRAKYLEDTILSIVKQKRFKETGEIEIVISDNCSEDNTLEISEKYVDIYGEKIRYYRNSENIKEANIERVLSLGKGIFLKLNNDTLMHQDNTLDKIIDSINQNIEKKEIIFFSNGTAKNITKCHCKNLDSFVKTVSFYSTWIVCFGIWKEDFASIDNFDTVVKLQLINDVLFRLISLNRSVFVDNTKIFNSISPKSKGGYNFYQVFVANYIGLLEEYRTKEKISWVTLFNEKSRLLIHFLIPWTLTLWRDKTKYSFNNKRVVVILFKKYRFHPFFYTGAVYILLRILIHQLKAFLSPVHNQAIDFLKLH
jgi:glycosyltransferase involved in cell wall biosynthesis